MLINGGVFYVKNKEDDIIFSLYLENFPNSIYQNAYIVGGLTSVDKKVSVKYARSWLSYLPKDSKKTLLARTTPEIAKVFVIPVGMSEMGCEEFEKIKNDYVLYMKRDNVDYELDDSEKMYIKIKSD